MHQRIFRHHRFLSIPLILIFGIFCFVYLPARSDFVVIESSNDGVIYHHPLVASHLNIYRAPQLSYIHLHELTEYNIRLQYE